ncbi:Rossmann-like and DUF2520 domain-containing protein [Sphingobacterium sp. SYP-B4668]|uniref:Rossmann-like and DUF2520 domain-containing protein n=1 Tax=Sphingobacterium sp. SYP-B4668 TaxID=2996035 RepID=UPI0022DDFF45|nr:Rossmann-like and DUF2520 domain-containing protein [Sphingobacterium sp. SYP-B4668]
MKIIILGSGNVATHLAKRLHQLGHSILQIYSRNKANAHALALTVNAIAVDEPDQLFADADLYLLAVSDEAIPTIVELLPNNLNGVIVHTSGATDIQVLEKFGHSGVLYPLQTLSKLQAIAMEQIPIGVEANSQETYDRLWKLAQELSPMAFKCDSQQRLAFHIAAVMANNFSNILYQIAYEILEAHDLPFDLLLPIIQETAKKVKNSAPIALQTGPAIRNDNITINKHLNFLRENRAWQEIYQQLTIEIAKRRGN